MNGKLLMFAAVAAFAIAKPAAAQRFMFSGATDAQVLTFVGKLQKAVSAGQRATVAEMIRYPLRVNYGATRHVNYANAAELLPKYDAIFTPTVRQAIVGQKADLLTGGRDGVAIKEGVVWIASKCDAAKPPKCALGVSSVNLQGEK